MKTLNRIKKSDDFATTIHKGNSFRLPSFIIHVRNNDLKYIRVGISASAATSHHRAILCSLP